jgi:hypothetical protein
LSCVLHETAAIPAVLKIKWMAKVGGMQAKFQEKRGVFWKGLCKMLIFNKNFALIYKCQSFSDKKGSIY